MLNVKSFLADLLGFIKTKTATPTFTKTSGAGNVTAVYFTTRSGVALMHITIKATSSVASATNLYIGTLQSGYRPATYVFGCGYYNGSAFVGLLTPDGGLTVRNCGTAQTVSYGVGLSFTYLLP